MYHVWQLAPQGKGLTVFRVPLTCINLPSAEMDLERSLKTQSSKSTVFPLPVGAEMTIFTSEWKQTGKHSLWSELKYLQVQFHENCYIKKKKNICSQYTEIPIGCLRNQALPEHFMLLTISFYYYTIRGSTLYRPSIESYFYQRRVMNDNNLFTTTI